MRNITGSVQNIANVGYNIAIPIHPTKQTHSLLTVKNTLKTIYINVVQRWEIISELKYLKKTIIEK